MLRADVDLASLPPDTPPSALRILRRCLDRDPDGFDIWILPLGQEGAEPSRFIETPRDEESAVFSPDDAFVAYQSNETGDDEIFIVSFPGKHLRAQVSTEGGISPRWNDDGTRLYFHSARDEVMAASVTLRKDAIEVGRPEVLFALTSSAYGNDDVHGDRLLIETANEGTDRPALHWS